MRKFSEIDWYQDWCNAVETLGISYMTELSGELLDNSCSMYVATSRLPEAVQTYKDLPRYQDAIYKINEGEPQESTESEPQAPHDPQDVFVPKGITIKAFRHQRSANRKNRLRRIEPLTMSVRPSHNGRGIVHEGRQETFNWKRFDRRLARRENKAECRTF